MTVNVCGVDLEMDIYDVDFYEKFESEVRNVNHKVNEIPSKRGDTAAQQLRRQCKAVKEFFDAVFGTGTADKLFHGKNNIKDCTVAYQTVINAAGAAMSAYNEETTKAFDEIRTKYAPEEDHQATTITYHTSPPNIGPVGPNRAQRRASGKKRKH